MTINELNKFVEDVYEIAFGADAFIETCQQTLELRGFNPEEVLDQLQEFSDQALKYDELLNVTKTLLVQVKEYSDNELIIGNGYTYTIKEIEEGLK